MANFRNITQVEEITTFSESDKLIVNSNGVAKQIGIDLIAGGVPDGGTTGQVLTKTSSVDGEAIWKNLPEVPQEVVFVNVTMTSESSGTADMTFSELTDACDRGAAIFAKVASTEIAFFIPLTIFARDECCIFSTIFEEGAVGAQSIMMAADNSVTLHLTVLPNTASAVSDAAGETVTAAEFNALLVALRNAGLMEQPAVDS